MGLKGLTGSIEGRLTGLVAKIEIPAVDDDGVAVVDGFGEERAGELQRLRQALLDEAGNFFPAIFSTAYPSSWKAMFEYAGVW